MEIGSAVWVRDETVAWTTGIITSKKAADKTGTFDVKIKRESDGVIVDFTVRGQDDTESDIIKLMNEKGTSNVDNLINLHHLHEPAILHSLHIRFIDDNIYTYTGPILIAVNPFKKLDFYDSQTLEAYYNFGIAKSQGITEHLVIDSVPPHIFSIADAAYRAMMKCIEEAANDTVKAVEQAVLISGESGAGKTKSTKLILLYLTTISVESREFKATGSVMDKVLQSNPILEAFGNARTLRNDNSSRFGKFIELKFNKRGHLIGGNLKTYLLEKVRLTSQQLGERNYHVFYQMAAGGSADDKKRWGYSSAETFSYVNQGKMFTLESIDDASDFKATLNSLKVLDFHGDDKIALLNISAAILHLGQIAFVKNDRDDGCTVAKSSLPHIDIASQLLGVSATMLTRVVTLRVMKVFTESVEKLLTSERAADARDALAKAIYSRLFDWLVKQINKEIQVKNDSDAVGDIGLLDIFGFECFVNNSFEQLCINYTNETLQYQFNKYVFELEQVEYKVEGIEWSFIEFPNNQDVLDLLEMNHSGLFSILDDECIIPKGSDSSFAGKLYTAFKDANRFSASQSQKSQLLFCINHYAGAVVYNSHGLLEKNKDEVPLEFTELFASSSITLLKQLGDSFIIAAVNRNSMSPKPGISLQRKKSSHKSSTVSSQFQEQLHLLMEKIYAAKPHYVRCVKPNDTNRPENFNPLRVAEQLRCGGVLEAVRVSRFGFQYRYAQADFFLRYKLIMNPFHILYSKLPKVCNQDDSQRICRSLISLALDDVSMPGNTQLHNEAKQRRKYEFVLQWRGKSLASKVDLHSIQVGKTKVFLQKSSHDFLEGRRSRLMYFSATKIQSVARRFLICLFTNKMVTASLKIRRCIRLSLFRKHIRNRVEKRCLEKEQNERKRHEIQVALEKVKEIEMNNHKLALKHAHDESLKKKRDKEFTSNRKEFEHIDALDSSVDYLKSVPNDVFTLYHKSLTREEQKIYEKQFPRVYNHDLMVNVFGIDQKSGGLSTIDEKKVSKWSSKAEIDGGISNTVMSDLRATPVLSWRERLFGGGFSFSKMKSAMTSKKSRVVKRTEFLEESYYSGTYFHSK